MLRVLFGIALLLAGAMPAFAQDPTCDPHGWRYTASLECFPPSKVVEGKTLYDFSGVNFAAQRVRAGPGYMGLRRQLDDVLHMAADLDPVVIVSFYHGRGVPYGKYLLRYGCEAVAQNYDPSAEVVDVRFACSRGPVWFARMLSDYIAMNRGNNGRLILAYKGSRIVTGDESYDPAHFVEVLVLSYH